MVSARALLQINPVECSRNGTTHIYGLHPLKFNLAYVVFGDFSQGHVAYS